MVKTADRPRRKSLYVRLSVQELHGFPEMQSTLRAFGARIQLASSLCHYLINRSTWKKIQRASTPWKIAKVCR